MELARPGSPTAKKPQRPDLKLDHFNAVHYKSRMKNFVLFTLAIQLTFSALAAPQSISDECVYKEIYYRYGDSCFAGNTKISTPTGSKAIADIQAGDQVLSFNPKTGKLVTGTVTATHKKLQQKTCVLRFGDGSSLRATPNHPFGVVPQNLIYDVNQMGARLDYFAIGSLGEAFVTSDFSHQYFIRLKGNEIINEGLSLANMIQAQEFSMPSSEDVYNITVDDQHNYFAEGVLVHNKK